MAQVSGGGAARVKLPGVRLRLPALRFRLRLSYSVAAWVFFSLVFAVLGICSLLFFFVELPTTQGKVALHLGADSGTYYYIAYLLQHHASGSADSLLGPLAGFVGLNGNLLGPALEALIFRTPFWIMVVNALFFLIGVRACRSTPGMNTTKLALLLGLNATTLVSIVTLNKEIFVLLSTLLFCRYIYTSHRSRFTLLVVLFAGLCARLHQPLMFLFFLFLQRRKSFFHGRPWLTVSLLVGAIAVSYPIALHFIDLTWATNQAQVGGAILILNRLQSLFGFPLVVAPKIAMALFNRTLTPMYWFTAFLHEDFRDLANVVVQNLSCFANFFLVLAAWMTGRLRLDRPIPLFCALYAIVLASSPFIQPRYEYPIYVALCFDMARREVLPSGVRMRFSPRGLLPRYVHRPSAP